MSFLTFIVIVAIIAAAAHYFNNLKLRMEKMEFRIDDLESRLRSLKLTVEELPRGAIKPVVKPEAPIAEMPKPEIPAPKMPTWEPPKSPAIPPVVRPPAPLPSYKPAPAKPLATPAARKTFALNLESIDWETFVGVKLFAWLGGFALFLAMAFFVKYSIDHNLISPLMRVTIGALTGTGVIIGGLVLSQNKKYAVTAQTLCAGGIAVLYADIFACRAVYNFLPPSAAFLLMTLVTAASFLLAVRLDARFVAILGMVGGFLTPPLLSTGVDHPIALFSYIAMLDLGVIAVSLKKRWGSLILLSASATLLMEMGWTAKFFTPPKIYLASGIYLFFSLLFAGALEAARRLKDYEAFRWPAALMPLLSLGFVAYLLTFPAIAAQPSVIFVLLLLFSGLLGFLAMQDSEMAPIYWMGTLIVFALTGVWALHYAIPAHLYLAGGFYLLLCLKYIAFAEARRGRADASTFGWPAACMPALSMVFVGRMLHFSSVGAHPLPVFGLLFALSLVQAFMALRDPESRYAYVAAHGISAFWIAVWFAQYFAAPNVGLTSGVVVAFCLLPLALSEIFRKKSERRGAFHFPAEAAPLLAMGYVASLMRYPTLGARPGIVLGFLLFFGALLLYQAVRREEARAFYALGTVASFFILGYWTIAFMKSGLLFWGLGFYLAFALVHSIAPIVIQKLRPSTSPFLLGYATPIVMLLLIFIAMLACDILSFVVWPFVLLLGMLAIATAWLAASITSMAFTVLLVMACFGVWIFRLPDPSGLPASLLLLAFFTCAFVGWMLLVSSRRSLFSGNLELSQIDALDPKLSAQLAAFTAFMPFLLVAMVCIQMKLANPAPIFGFLVLINVLLLALSRTRGLGMLAGIAMASTAVVESLWHVRSFAPAAYLTVLPWYAGFYLLFLLFPFVANRKGRSDTPWIASALSGPAHFFLFYNLAVQVVGKSTIGAIPAMLAIPSLLSLAGLLKAIPKNDERRTSLVALFGAVALLFITLIIPLQFDKEWITFGWALEGAALLWLLRRVPHDGLLVWGTALLFTAFARLALNPAVFSYHPRTGTPFLNWYLLVYGAAGICFYLAARWLPTARRTLLGTELPPLFNSLGTILLFLLTNIEIADFFSTGATITFNFSGNLQQDMTYSLAWGAFAIAVLIAGIRSSSKKVRYASLSLLMVTIVKVFLHDLWRLGGLTRVASIIGLSIVLILVSFLYQRYLLVDEQEKRS